MALLGVVVAGITGAATVLFAILALKATNRANASEAAARVAEAEARASEAEDRARAQRGTLMTAIDAYLKTWEPWWRLDAKVDLDAARAAFRAAAAAVSPDGPDVAALVIAELARTEKEAVEDYKARDDSTSSEVLVHLAIESTRSLLHYRAMVWVATGVLDRTPVYNRLPPPPPLDPSFISEQPS